MVHGDHAAPFYSATLHPLTALNPLTTPSTLASSGEVRRASKAARRSACGLGQSVKAASLESTARREGSAHVFLRLHAPGAWQ